MSNAAVTEMGTPAIHDTGSPLPSRASPDEAPEWLLRHGIRSILRCDDAEIVGQLVDYMYVQYRSLRFLSAVVDRTRLTFIPSAITLLGALKSYLCVRPAERGDGVIWVARLANERRVIESLMTQVPDLAWSEVRLDWRIRPADVVDLVRVFRLTVRRIMRISRRLHARHPGFKVLRVAELIGFYLRFRRIFERGQYALAVMSSHSNPHGIAFNIAARRAGVPVALITHGMPLRPVARLSYDLAVVHCDDARRTYEEDGCRIACVLVHGRGEHLAPMPAGPLPRQLVVGVFLCKDVNAPRLRAVIESLLADRRVAQILVRPHPFNMWIGLQPWLASLSDARVASSAGGAVFDDIARSDVVLAGNTSALIEAVVAGRPSAYVSGLDHAPEDLHRLVARGLVYGSGDSFRFEPEAMLHFYQRPEWPRILRQFANVDEDEAVTGARAATSLRALVATHEKRRSAANVRAFSASENSSCGSEARRRP